LLPETTARRSRDRPLPRWADHEGHALSDGAGRLLVVLLTAGNVHDSPMFGQLLAVAGSPPRAGTAADPADYLVADKGYSSRANRDLLRARGIGHTIPEKADQAAYRRRCWGDWTKESIVAASGPISPTSS
jgi:transposase